MRSTSVSAGLHENTDDTMALAARVPCSIADTLPNSDYVIHEASPNAQRHRQAAAQTGIRQFPGDNADPLGVRASARMSSETNMRAEVRTPSQDD